MHKWIALILVTFCFLLVSCERYPDAAALAVEFTWDGYKHCGMGLPQMQIDGIPENTKFLEVSMYDHEHGFDHGKVEITYAGSGTINSGSYTEITGPCPPPNNPGRYKITVKALDANEAVIGIGSKEKYFPEEE
jgi:phosphatidylethanolamine-binding protein (PEBP) family uncharacterized protein